MTLNEAVNYHTRYQNCTLFLRNLRHYPADEVEKRPFGIHKPASLMYGVVLMPMV